MGVKITDLVDPKEIERLKELDAELEKVLDTYTKVAKDLAKGLEINVSIAGDIDRLEKHLVEKGKEAVAVQRELTQVIDEQSKAIANTTNTIARELMEQERVNKTQRAAYIEHERVKKLLDQYHDTYDGQISRLIELDRQLKENKKEQTDLEKALKAGKITMDAYEAKQSALVARHRELSQEKRTLNQIMTAEEKAAQTQEGSYAHMSQQLELLKKAYKELGVEGRESDFGKELENTIQNLDAHLKDMAADMGEFQRNVGNYAIANAGLKKNYDELIGVLASLQTQYGRMTEAQQASEEGEKLAESIKEIADAARETRQALDEQARAILDARNSIEATGESNSNIKKDLKDLVLEIANLTLEYQKLSEEEQASAEGQALADHIRELTERAGELRDAIGDVNAAISNAASDTRSFDQLGGALQLAIDGFGLAEGAAAMLGIGEEELAEIQTKLQAAIAASNAMQSIQNTLQAQSSLMQGVALVQTKLRTIAENLHTAAQGRGVLATKAATAAQWAFNAAANANPIGLVVVAVIACIAAVWGLVKAFKAFFGTSDEAVEKCKQQKRELDELIDANDKLIERMKARGATESELLNQSLQNKIVEKEAAEALFARVSELYDEDEDEYKEALEAKKKADEDYNSIKEDSLNHILKIVHGSEEEQKKASLGTYEYKRQLIQKEKEMQDDVLRTLLAQKEITQSEFEDLIFALDKATRLKIDSVNDKEEEEKAKKAEETRKNAVAAAEKTAQELKKAVQAGEDALLKIITDSHERQRQAELLSYNRQLSELQEQLKKTGSAQVALRRAINNQIEGLTAEHNRKMEELQLSGLERINTAEAELISSRLSIVQAGTEEEWEWKQKELSNQYQAELLTLQKSEMSKTITVEQAEEMRTNLAIKYASLREKAEQEHAETMAELIEKRYASEQTDVDNAYIAAVNALKRRYAEELAAAKGNLSQQQAIKAKFEQEQTRLSEQYAQQTARNSIAMLEEVLKNEQLSADDRLKYEQALAKAKCDLETAMADASIEQIERITEADQKAGEQRRQNAQMWLQVASDSLNTISDLVATVYDAKISKVEEEQEANQAAGDEEQARISELVEKKVITEEEGEARKRAAEAKTAQKNEELEKKKQQLKHKQAVWDKANSIAQAGIATALAITQALPNLVLAAIAGAMGALQIATILATPIPKYAKGTDRHKGGPAIVGDGGVPELVMFGGKSWITPDTPTVVDLPAGAVVVPRIDGIEGASDMVAIPELGESSAPVIVNNDYKRLEEKMDKFIYILLRHSNRQYQGHIDTMLANYISERI